MKCEWCGENCKDIFSHPVTNQVYCSDDCFQAATFGINHTLELTPESYNAVIDLIENPPKPTQKLIDLVKKWK